MEERAGERRPPLLPLTPPLVPAIVETEKLLAYERGWWA